MNGVRIDRTVPTITFVNRNLERLRGFDMFMRSLPLIQKQHPKVRVLIVGDNEPGYGGGDRHAAPLRQRMMQELSGQLDMETNPLSWSGAPSGVDGIAAGQLGARVSQLSFRARLEPP